MVSPRSYQCRTAIYPPLHKRNHYSHFVGFTQSGPRFRGKTRALEKMLAKTLAPASISPVMIYPSGPNRLQPSDVPGFDKDLASESGEEIEMWCWFRKVDYPAPTPKDGAAKPKDKYRLFDEGMATVTEAIREAGGIDAVCGFSQGGAMTGFVASALEPGRVIPDGPEHDWARNLREANGGKGVKFAIAWCGFAGTPPELQWLYEPKIKTPTLHMIGSLDEVVDESRSQALVDRCENPQVVTHPGGHHVPVAKQWTMPVAGFMNQHFQDNTPRAGL